MCGICGEFRFRDHAAPDLARLARVTAALRHRGPDDEGRHADRDCALAMRRLSIIDLDSGHQPLTNEDETVHVILNGEIYNYVELRRELERQGHRFKTHSDTETIPHLYEERGDDFVSSLNGMFGLALWDARRRRLVVARDRAGIKPLYYALTAGGLVFCSELRPMLQFDEVDDALDREALAEYLGSGYVLGPRTILRGVRKLMPGQMLIADDEGCRFRDYWQWPVGHGTWRSIDEAIEEFLPILEKALDRQLRADVPIGLFLSGGTDSRLLAATATRRLDRQVGALTVGFSDSRFDESGVAIDSAAALGLPIDRLALTEKDLLSEIPQVLEATDEPLWDTSAIPTYLLCGAARRKFTVAISGDGGDELFGGYPTYLLDRPAALFRRLPAAGQRMLRAAANLLPAGDGYLDFAEKAKRFTAAAGHPSAAAHPRYKHLLLDRNQPEFWRDAPAGNPFAGFEAAYDAAADLGLGETERLLYADFHTFMVDDCLVKMDRMSMAHSLEVRVPLLDNDIIDFAARLPIEWKLRGRTLKFFLKRTLKRLAPELPVDLPKRGFTPPMAAWLNGALRPLADETLSASAVKQRGLFESGAVGKVIGEHRAKRHDHSRLLWALIVLEHWLARHAR